MLFTACICVVGSCGNGNVPASSSVIRFWHFWSEPGQRAAIRQLVQEFEKSHNTTVELTELSWNEGKTKLQAAFNSGAPPDVVELGSDWVAQFSSAGVLMPLPIDSAVTTTFPAFTLAPAMWRGRLFAYPWVVDTRVLYVNRSILDSAGWKGAVVSLDDLLNACEMVHDKGMKGFGANGADAHRLYKKILPLIWTFGGDVVNSSGRITLNTPENVKAFSLYASLARTGYIETQRQLDAAFLQGKVAFWISGSWLIPRIRENPALRVEAMLMPGTGTGPGLSFTGGEYLAVSAATKNTQRSRELAQFLTNGRNALALCKRIAEAGFPADKGTLSDTSLLRDPMKAVFARQLQYSRMTPVHPRWLDVEAILENALVRVLLGESSAAESLLQAQEEADRLVQGT